MEFEPTTFRVLGRVFYHRATGAVVSCSVEVSHTNQSKHHNKYFYLINRGGFLLSMKQKARVTTPPKTLTISKQHKNTLTPETKQSNVFFQEK